jgi:hypothetical protein
MGKPVILHQAQPPADLGACTPMVYTALLNERGGFESDLTVITLPPDAGGERFLLVTGSAQPVRDVDWIRRHIGAHEHALLTDVSPLWSVLGVMGPRAASRCARSSSPSSSTTPQPTRGAARRCPSLASRWASSARPAGAGPPVAASRSATCAATRRPLMSCVVKPPRPYWFFGSSKAFSASARSR